MLICQDINLLLILSKKKKIHILLGRNLIENLNTLGFSIFNKLPCFYSFFFPVSLFPCFPIPCFSAIDIFNILLKVFIIHFLCVWSFFHPCYLIFIACRECLLVSILYLQWWVYLDWVGAWLASLDYVSLGKIVFDLLFWHVTLTHIWDHTCLMAKIILFHYICSSD